jgi:hypothetical protein
MSRHFSSVESPPRIRISSVRRTPTRTAPGTCRCSVGRSWCSPVRRRPCVPRIHALDRGLALSIFTADLFAIGNDHDNRAAVGAVGRDDLDLVGLALHADRKLVDKVVKGARMHP